MNWWNDDSSKTFIIAWAWGQTKGGGCLLLFRYALEYYNRKMGLFYTLRDE